MRMAEGWKGDRQGDKGSEVSCTVVTPAGVAESWKGDENMAQEKEV